MRAASRRDSAGVAACSKRWTAVSAAVLDTMLSVLTVVVRAAAARSSPSVRDARAIAVAAGATPGFRLVSLVEP